MTELFLCRCHDTSHQMILMSDNGDKSVYGSFHLENYRYWNRIKSACKYTFNINRRDGDFDILLFMTEDIDKLSAFAKAISHNNAIADYTPRVYEETNSGERWKITELYKWVFKSRDIDYHWTVSYHECLTRNQRQKDLEVQITPFLADRSVVGRIIVAFKYLFGYRSCYGEMDSFEWAEADSPGLNGIIQAIKHS